MESYFYEMSWKFPNVDMDLLNFFGKFFVKFFLSSSSMRFDLIRSLHTTVLRIDGTPHLMS